MALNGILTVISVKIDVDIERFVDHVKSHRPSKDNEERVAINLAKYRKFFLLGEERPAQNEPLVLVDCHGRIMCWYLPNIFGEQSLVSVCG